MIKDFKNKNGNYVVRFEKFYGTGWSGIVEKAISEKLKVDSISKNEIRVSWNSSEYQYQIRKQNISFELSMDDDSPNAFILKENITEENKKKLREWATIIAQEVEQGRVQNRF